jgi:hypothetical protein
MVAFATSKGKAFSIDEWGVSGPNGGPFVTAMAEYLRAKGIRSHTYWESNSAYPGELHRREREWPGTVAAFKKAFGR